MKKKSLFKKAVIIIGILAIIIPISGYVTIQALMGELSIFLPYSKSIMGFDREKNYLLIFQNNNELRPTGGFISAYAVVKFENGDYDFDFKDSYNLKVVNKLSKAPDPFNIFMEEDEKFKGFYFRDGNFEVDFADSAANLEKLYSEQSGSSSMNFDGVIAVNFELLEDLLDTYELNLNETKLERQNLFALLEHEVKNIDTHNVEMLDTRKDVLAKLFKDLISEMKYSVSKYGSLFEIIKNSLNEKKIILFFKDKELQELVESKNWAGRFQPEKYKNFIYPNLANIGGRKTDRYMRKTHQFHLSFDESWQPKVTHTLTIEHLGSRNLNSDTYQGYLRIFLPKDIDFLSADGNFFNGLKGFKKEGYFEAYLKIDPGETRKITIEYLLPKDSQARSFNLDLIKQPGTKDFWQISVQLPGDNSFSAKDFDVRENLGMWSGNLDQDKHFKLQFLPDKTPPLVLWQKFLQQNEIEVAFSESLDKSTVLNPENYKITDLNYINQESDNIKVKSVKFEHNSAILETEGINRAEEERYKLEIGNIKDMYQNPTDPSTVILTVVQRL